MNPLREASLRAQFDQVPNGAQILVLVFLFVFSLQYVMY